MSNHIERTGNDVRVTASGNPRLDRDALSRALSEVKATGGTLTVGPGVKGGEGLKRRMKQDETYGAMPLAATIVVQ